MFNFLKSILMKDTVGSSLSKPVKLGQPVQYYNNSCETLWYFDVQVPAGFTVTLTGQITQGLEGGTVPDDPLGLGVFNLTEGIYRFSINLGNSGQSGVASTYVASTEDQNGDTQAIIARRNEIQSAFYDQAPC